MLVDVLGSAEFRIDPTTESLLLQSHKLPCVEPFNNGVVEVDGNLSCIGFVTVETSSFQEVVFVQPYLNIFLGIVVEVEASIGSFPRRAS